MNKRHRDRFNEIQILYLFFNAYISYNKVYLSKKCIAINNSGEKRNLDALAEFIGFITNKDITTDVLSPDDDELLDDIIKERQLLNRYLEVLSIVHNINNDVATAVLNHIYHSDGYTSLKYCVFDYVVWMEGLLLYLEKKIDKKILTNNFLVFMSIFGRKKTLLNLSTFRFHYKMIKKILNKIETIGVIKRNRRNIKNLYND